MATSKPSCGACDRQNITKSPIVWCTDCDEGLCSECQKHHRVSKPSQNHNTLPITEFHELPKDVQQITQNCDKHNEKYTIYCKKHKCPCCGNCVVEDHIDCRDFSRLTDIIDKTKTSEALIEIEQSLADLAENIQRIRHNRENNLKTLSEKKSYIEKEIKETRVTINNHLDKMQDAVLKTLNTSEEKERREISLSLTLLDGKGAEISEYQKKIVKIKQHATDLQTFLSLKQLENKVSCENEFLQSLVDTDSLKESVLSYNVHNFIHKFLTDIRKFGDITIEKKSCDVILTRRKDKQAQMLVPHVSNRSVKHINLKLYKTVNTINYNASGCCMLPDGNMAFTYYGSSKLNIFSTDGSHDFCMWLRTNAFDIAYISEDNTLAVTSGESKRKCLTIIDIQNKLLKEDIAVTNYCYGIAVKDTQLICSASGKGIQLIDPYNNSTREIVRDTLPKFCYVTRFGDKIYHTNSTTNSITCYDLHGSVQWTFKNVSVLNGARGITVDNVGNVYVAGTTSNNVVVISADGQQHKEILTASDGLSGPNALDYCKSTDMLLVANCRNSAMLFAFV
ncbi:uncharacterized protein LOC127704999 [Mytilus californianus]|uniref:uncharacterized protein LOC127704999 n=1 Tax=Mytilus californianus TaxID=6549 RepID=UPI0022460A6D|nr:uncharacterized protein LOC127704999 [Mytilus californianus]